MTETPMPVAFDPETLETLGQAPYDDDLDGHTRSAHPHHDDGDTFNYVTAFSRTSTYRLYRMPEGGREREVIAALDRKRPAYMHSFGLTEQYVVLAEFPYVVNPLGIILRDRPFIENYQWDPERGTRFVVVDRDSGEVVADPVADPFFAFHHVNAFEDDGDVVVDVCRYDDASVVDALYLDEIRSPDFAMPQSTLDRYRVPLDGGAVASERLYDGVLELPRINYERSNGRPYQYVYGVSTRPTAVDDMPNRLVKVDVETSAAAVWEAPNTYPSEPVFVGAPDADAADDGVVLSLVLDAETDRSFLLVLDASTFEELARASVPHHVPVGFHGGFYEE
jgi:carotenoid cleavage dioxygenase-like enzyme